MIFGIIFFTKFEHLGLVVRNVKFLFIVFFWNILKTIMLSFQFLNLYFPFFPLLSIIFYHFLGYQTR